MPKYSISLGASSASELPDVIRYLRVRWRHDFADEPVFLYSEVIDGWETRKVEIFPDGRSQFAGPGVANGDTRLSVEPLPSTQEISQDQQFSPEEISAEEFEEVWRRLEQ